MNACVVIPCYNHSGTVAHVASAALDHVPVIVVDDGSTRPPPPIPGAVVLRLERNSGKGAALRAGFHRALDLGHTHAISLDADGQLAPDDLPGFLEATRRDERALVVGVRDFSAAGAPPLRHATNLLSNLLVRLETGLRLADTQCGYRSYPIASALALPTRSPGYAYELEILVQAAWAGIPIRDVPVRCLYAREFVRGSHFLPLRDTARFARVHLRLLVAALTARRSRLPTRADPRHP